VWFGNSQYFAQNLSVPGKVKLKHCPTCRARQAKGVASHTTFLMKRLPKVTTEMALHVPTYNLTRL
jgi:hypothetical protein